MLSDDSYAKYLASLVPEFHGNPFLEEVKKNSPVDYLQILLNRDEDKKAKKAEEVLKKGEEKSG